MDVVIRAPSLNHALGAIGCLRALAGVDFKFIVVSQQDEVAGSDDVEVVHYPFEDYSYSTALNLGIGAASSEFVFVCSSHSRVSDSSEAFSEAVDLLLRENCAAVSFAPRSSLQPESEANKGRFADIARGNFDGFNGLNNSCAILKRPLWERFPFDESLPSAEDQHWTRDVIREGLFVSRWNWKFHYAYENSRPQVYKKARDVVVVSRSIRPDLRRFSALIGELGRAAKNLCAGNVTKARVRILTVLMILVDRVKVLDFDARY